MNLLQDQTFRLGFKLKGLNSIRDGHRPIRVFRTGKEEPVWYLCQWNSRHNLADSSLVWEESGYSVGDESKRLMVRGDEVRFRLFASREYSRPRAEGEGWPHLLVEQDITAGNALAGAGRLELRGEVRLDSLRDCMGGENRDYHTAQFVWVVVLKNCNPRSSDFGRFVWVVLCPFDSRFTYSPPYYAQDCALPDGEFIYTLDARDFLDKPVAFREWVRIRLDLLPRVEDILAKANINGFLRETKKDDLFLVATNMGFEVTGTYDVEMSARNLGIYLD